MSLPGGMAHCLRRSSTVCSSTFFDFLQGARSTAECRESARIWAEIFSEQEGKYAASFEVHGKEKRQVAANVHKGRGSTAQLDGEAFSLLKDFGNSAWWTVSKQLVPAFTLDLPSACKALFTALLTTS